MGQKANFAYFHGVIVTLATMSLIACSNGSGGGGQPPVNGSTPTNTNPSQGANNSQGAQQNPPNLQKNNSSNSSSNSNSNSNSSTPSTMLSPVPGQSNNQATPANPGQANNQSNNQGNQANPSNQQNQTPSLGKPSTPANGNANASNNNSNPNSNPNPNSNQGQQQAPAPIGNVGVDLPTNPGNHYTGTLYAKMGNDSAVEVLAGELDKVSSSKKRQRNLLAAGDIDSIESKLDKESQFLDVDVVYEGKSAVQESEALGGILKDFRAKLGSKGQFEGRLQCLDQAAAEANMCYTAEVDLHNKVTGADVKAIVRHSNATVDLLDSDVTDPSPEFKHLLRMFKASLDGNLCGECIFRTLDFETTEIVHGKSIVRISFVGSDNQVIGLFGSLKVPNKQAPYSVGILRKDIRPQSVLYSIDDPAKIRTDLQDTIIDAQLMGTANASEFDLILNVKGTADEPVQKINLRIKRDMYPINLPN
jgi:hypothetical protein